MHLIIKKIIKQRGVDVLYSKTLISCMDDEGAFDDIEMRPYKKILRAVVTEDYSHKIAEIGEWNAEAEALARTFAQRNKLQEDEILYIFSCLAYGLGWLKKAPQIPSEVKKIRQQEAQKKAKEAEAIQKASEEAIRLKAEEAARKKAEAAEKRAREAERRMAEAERKAKEAEAARRKAENDARLKLAEEERKKAEAEARIRAEEARKRAEEDARRQAEETARKKAEEKAKQQAKKEAKAKAARREKIITIIIISSLVAASLIGLLIGVIAESKSYSDGTYIYADSEMTILRSYETNPCGELIIPDNVEKIEANAFKHCKELTAVYVGNQVQEIEANAFKGCANLRSVTLNSNALVKGGSLFSPTAAISEIFGSQVQEYIIGENVTQIGEKAFSKCIDLSSITIPKSVVSISYNAFAECPNLTMVTINSNAILSNEPDIGFFSSAYSPMAKMFGEQVITYIIGDDVSKICKFAFYQCTSLTSIKIGKNVNSIGKNAFAGCSGLTSLKLPSGLTVISESMFHGCKGLKSITISKGVTWIQSFAFSNCANLTTITIPRNVKTISQYAFNECTSLGKVSLPRGIDYDKYLTFSDCPHVKFSFY